IVNSISDSEVKFIVEELSLDDAVDFLSEVPANVVTRVLKNTTEEKRKLINHFLNYPEDSAGSIMTIEFVQFNENITAQKAMADLRATGINKETIYTCYVVDSRRILVGIISLRRLITAKENVLIKDIMEEDILYVRTLDDRENVANIFKKYDLIALPVVDNERRLVGIITVDDVMDVIEEEETEDIEKMAALMPSDDEYLKTSIFTMSKNRIVWLLVLMISGTLSSMIIGYYESALATCVILTTFFPILMGTGGNAGAQASTLIIRGMAVGEIETKDVLKVVWKELRVSAITGTILGIVNFFRILVLKSAPINVNLAVSTSLIFVVIVAKCIGCTLPMAAKRLKFDPAIMAAPLITTIVDCVALLLFFKAAQIFVL
ncbi:MAG: magnesium transporter, partial [Anaerotignaceae bacterium]